MFIKLGPDAQGMLMVRGPTSTPWSSGRVRVQPATPPALFCTAGRFADHVCVSSNTGGFRSWRRLWLRLFRSGLCLDVTVCVSFSVCLYGHVFVCVCISLCLRLTVCVYGGRGRVWTRGYESVLIIILSLSLSLSPSSLFLS